MTKCILGFMSNGLRDLPCITQFWSTWTLDFLGYVFDPNYFN